jgi:uncharacterized protein YcbK (DUF882 family)
MEQIVQLNSNAKLSEHLASPSEAALSNLSELNCVRLSPHFTLGEFTKSGSHPEVYNIPSHEAIANLKRLCTWLEVLRERYNDRYVVVKRDVSTTLDMTGGGGAPIRINSGYRSPQLNKKIGGVPTSNHLTGCAADIRVLGMEQLIRYAAILLDYADESKQEFDELLIERNRYGAIWLHFAVRPRDNRRKIAFINA